MVLIYEDGSNEDLTFTLYYKHEDDDNFQEVNSNNKQVDDNADEYQLNILCEMSRLVNTPVNFNQNVNLVGVR